MTTVDDIVKAAEALGFEPDADWLTSAGRDVERSCNAGERVVAVSEANVVDDEAFGVLTDQALHVWRPDGQRRLEWTKITERAKVGAGGGPTDGTDQPVALMADGATIVLTDLTEARFRELALMPGDTSDAPGDLADVTPPSDGLLIDLTDESGMATVTESGDQLVEPDSEAPEAAEPTTLEADASSLLVDDHMADAAVAVESDTISADTISADTISAETTETDTSARVRQVSAPDVDSATTVLEPAQNDSAVADTLKAPAVAAAAVAGTVGAGALARSATATPAISTSTAPAAKAASTTTSTTDPWASIDGRDAVQQRSLPVRVLWFLLVGWWASALLLIVGWVVSLLVVTVPVATGLMALQPGTTTLFRPGKASLTFEPAGLASFRREGQYPAIVRLAYMLIAGWLFALVACVVAWVLSLTWVGRSSSAAILDVYPTILTLQRD